MSGITELDNQYLEILSQPNVRLIKALKTIKSPKKSSYFLSRLDDAKKLGDEWEGRDIQYYHMNKMLEEEKNKKQEKNNENHIKLAHKKRIFNQNNP